MAVSWQTEKTATETMTIIHRKIRVEKDKIECTGTLQKCTNGNGEAQTSLFPYRKLSCLNEQILPKKRRRKKPGSACRHTRSCETLVPRLPAYLGVGVN